ncbi:hypothetical protein B5M45_14265 [Mycobacterium simiae]|uniref:Uncharacterized protein n=1 Tax=Mycobacterium simiae TaxID=1784 RepID=A0A1X0Y4L6_MYCSI|nr:hypothetical protein B5M45_14265 [Mycobacterium simiae]
MPATMLTMPGGRPELPDNCEAMDARVAPGFTSIGQIDCPIAVSEPVGGSACAGPASPTADSPSVIASAGTVAATAARRRLVSAVICPPGVIVKNC